MGLRSNEGVWVEEKEEVVNMLLGYYEHLFKSSLPTHIEEAMAPVPQVVSSSMNERLTSAFTEVKVEEALK